jgi:hypothetical protein
MIHMVDKQFNLDAVIALTKTTECKVDLFLNTYHDGDTFFQTSLYFSNGDKYELTIGQTEALLEALTSLVKTAQIEHCR